MSYFLFDKSLLPLGREAAPGWVDAVFQKGRRGWFRGRFAAQREQAPSPQKPFIIRLCVPAG